MAGEEQQPSRFLDELDPVDGDRPLTPPLRGVHLGALVAELRAHGRRHLREAQRLLAAAPAAIMPALLPVALAGPTLARMERRGYDPFTPFEIAGWRRQLRVWRAAKWPHRMFA